MNTQEENSAKFLAAIAALNGVRSLSERSTAAEAVPAADRESVSESTFREAYKASRRSGVVR